MGTDDTAILRVRAVLLRLEKDNPPGDLITFEWKYRLKSAVNAKLGRPNISIEAARAEWLEIKKPLRVERVDGE